MERTENIQYDILQVRVRKLSFPEFMYLVQTRQVGFNVNKRPNWILIILKSLWKGQDLELEVKDSNSETWWISIDHFISQFLFLNNWIDNIFFSEVSLKIRLGNEGEVIK